MMSYCRRHAVSTLAPREARLSGSSRRVHLGAVHLGRVDSRGLRPRCCNTVGAAKLSGQRRDNQSQRRDIQAHPSAHVTPAQLGPSICRTPLPTPLMLGIAPSG